MTKYKNLKDELDKTFLDLQKKKFNSEDNNQLVAAIGKDILESLLPVIEKLVESNRLSQSELKQILSEMKFDIPSPKIPDIDTSSIREAIIDSISAAFDNIQIPEPKVNVNVPPLNIKELAAKITIPSEMDIKGWVRLQGVDLQNPLPVQLRDKDGKPVNLFENLTTLVSQGGGSGKHDFFTIKGFSQSAYSEIMNADGRLRVSTEAVSGSLDTVKTTGIARQTNPTAVSDGDNQRIATDDLGRTLTRPIQVRDLITTAYATLINGTETTLISGVAGSYLDLIYIMGANNSSVAATVNLRMVTGGNVVMTIQIPANGTAGIACPVPLPQSNTGNNWTADLEDITGTSVYLTALFSREV